MRNILFNKRTRNPILCCERCRGFTLIELLLVISIIGILAGIAVPLFLGERTKALQAEANTNLQALRLVLEQYYAENACYYKSGANCANSTLTLAGITSAFPGFKPGDAASLKFDYKLVVAGTPSATTFTATAKGKSGAIKDTKFCINQNNEMSGGSGCTW